MTSKQKNVRFCRKCGVPLEPGRPGRAKGICPQCAVALADGYIPEKTSAGLTKSQKKSRASRFALWVIFFLCIGVTLGRIPALRESMEDPRHIRLGTHETDPRTDACIENLWYAAKVLQESGDPPRDRRCPASGKPYQFTEDEDHTVILCPNPEKHGLRLLRLNSGSLLPEVVR